MQPDALRRLARQLREGRISIGERFDWADRLAAWAEKIEALEAERKQLAETLSERGGSSAMTEEQLREIEARAAAATEGPWTMEVEEYEDDSGQISISEIGRLLHNWDWADPKDWDRDLANTEFIANAREDVPALVAEVRRLRKALGSIE